MEYNLEKVVQLFLYLTEKDLFAEIYRNQLAKRRCGEGLQATMRKRS